MSKNLLITINTENNTFFVHTAPDEKEDTPLFLGVVCFSQSEKLWTAEVYRPFEVCQVINNAPPPSLASAERLFEGCLL